MINRENNPHNFVIILWVIFNHEFQIEGATKRTVLRDICSTYDPLGFLNPILINGKVLIQKNWGLAYGWDDIIEPDLVKEWESVVISIKANSSKKFKRWFGIKKVDKVSLHCFADAGQDSRVW